MMKQGVLDPPTGLPVNPVEPPPSVVRAAREAAYLPTGVYHFRTQLGGRVVECTLRVGVAGVIEPEDTPAQGVTSLPRHEGLLLPD